MTSWCASTALSLFLLLLFLLTSSTGSHFSLFDEDDNNNTMATLSARTVLLTGATDGLGLATALRLAAGGHTLLLHGRSKKKLAAAATAVRAVDGAGRVETYRADLSDLAQVSQMAAEVRAAESRIDVLINNAGVLKTSQPRTESGHDVRFVVNTLAPALLTRELLPLVPPEGRLVHLSSAAQAAVNIAALEGEGELDDMDAYAQSKLALTMWSQALAAELGPDGPVSVAVNPGSLLATKMVREGFGVSGSSVEQGTDILTRAAFSDEFADASGRYFDNDSGSFASPHPAASKSKTVAAVVGTIESLIAEHKSAI